MTKNNPNYNFRAALLSTDGTVIPFDIHTGYCALLENKTYYFPLGGVNADTPGETALVAAMLQSSTATFAATITIEDTIMFELLRASDRGQPFVTSWSTTVGDWIPENPSTAIVPVVGTGWSSVAATVTAAGTGIGACLFHLGNLGSSRGRVKVVTAIGGGGNVRLAVNGKLSG